MLSISSQHRILSVALINVLCACYSPAAEKFSVLQNAESPSPASNAKDVATDTFIRVLFSAPMDPQSLTAQSMQLLDPNGAAVPAFLQTDLTGGVATLAPTLRLKQKTRYTLKITTKLKSQAGSSIIPFTSAFTTTNRKAKVDRRFVYRPIKIDDRNSNACLTVGPDNHLYVTDTYGEMKRYQLHAKTGRVINTDVAYHSKDDQIVGLCWDPDATADKLILWISYARYGANYTGTIAKLVLPPIGSNMKPAKTDYVIGLPHDDLLHHQPNGIDFGPDGRLYQSVGGVCTLGGSPNWGMKEVPLSAAILVADVRNPKFNGGKLPCNVQTSAPVRYDPFAKNAPVAIYATGLRNAYDLCRHSTGHLFSATNQNSIRSGVFTPASPDKKIPAIIATPREMLYRIERGKYYGHPNPSRGQYVLNGGNPTSGRDAFEVTEYPVGVQPNVRFDPDLIYDLRPGGGNSANGMAEHRGPGALKGRLLIAYFSGAKCIQSFAIDKTGKITHEHPLIDEEGNVIRFKGAIDVAVHPKTGRVYVADFGEWKRPHHGLKGAVWMLEPQAK